MKYLLITQLFFLSVAIAERAPIWCDFSVIRDRLVEPAFSFKKANRYSEYQFLRTTFPYLDRARLNHIRYYDGQFEVMTIQSNGTLKMFTTKDPARAKKLALSIRQPVNLQLLRALAVEDQRNIKEVFNTLNLSEEIGTKTRVKSLESLKDKIFIRYREQDEFVIQDLRDIAAGRITTNSQKEVDEIVNLIKAKFGDRVLEIDIKNKESGYQAIHVDLITESGRAVEIQVMTKAMQKWHAWEHGIIYKSNKVRSDAELARLQEYSLEVIRYLRGESIVKPDYRDFHLDEGDAFDF